MDETLRHACIDTADEITKNVQKLRTLSTLFECPTNPYSGLTWILDEIADSLLQTPIMINEFIYDHEKENDHETI